MKLVFGPEIMKLFRLNSGQADKRDQNVSTSMRIELFYSIWHSISLSNS